MNACINPNRLLAACAALLLVSSLSAQPPTPGYREPGPGTTKKEDMVSHSDKVFLEKAAKSGAKAVVVSQVVLPNLTTQAARDFARMMIRDHGAANEELKAIAARKAVSLPPEDRAGKLKCSDKVKNFDDVSYLREMVSDHNECVELFEKAAKSEDPDIAAFARKTLPILQHHLELAKGDKQQVH